MALPRCHKPCTSINPCCVPVCPPRLILPLYTGLWNLRLKSEFWIDRSCFSSRSNEKSVSVNKGGRGLEMSTDQKTKIHQIAPFTFLIFKIFLGDIPPTPRQVLLWFANGDKSLSVVDTLLSWTRHLVFYNGKIAHLYHLEPKPKRDYSSRKR